MQLYQKLASSLSNQLSISAHAFVLCLSVASHKHGDKSETHLVSAGVMMGFSVKKKQLIPL